ANDGSERDHFGRKRRGHTSRAEWSYRVREDHEFREPHLERECTSCRLQRLPRRHKSGIEQLNLLYRQRAIRRRHLHLCGDRREFLGRERKITDGDSGHTTPGRDGPSGATLRRRPPHLAAVPPIRPGIWVREADY